MRSQVAATDDGASTSASRAVAGPPTRSTDCAAVPPGDGPEWLSRRLDHRAIGVVYRPERERWGNYVPTVVGRRYDAFLYLEETSPLRPLHLERADEHVPPLAHAV